MGQNKSVKQNETINVGDIVLEQFHHTICLYVK